MKKLQIYKLLLWLNVVSLIFTFFQLGYYLVENGKIILPLFVDFRFIFAVFSGIFWLWNFVLWAKHDRNIWRLLGFIFLHQLYALIYSQTVLDLNWLDEFA